MTATFGIMCCTPFVDNSHPWIKGLSMDASKCSSEACIRFMEKYRRMTLADRWMGGFRSWWKKWSSVTIISEINLVVANDDWFINQLIQWKFPLQCFNIWYCWYARVATRSRDNGRFWSSNVWLIDVSKFYVCGRS